MIRKLIFLSLSLFAHAVELGIDRIFEETYVTLIENKRVGLITNQTGANKELKSTIECFLEGKTYKLAALFAPEHGLDGSAYAAHEIKDFRYKDLPVFSLHGKTRRPTEKMLKTIDVLVFDIQDIGIRSYTYVTTLFYAMEEAAKQGIPVIVLDRPNPMGGLLVDGPMLEKQYRSFIGYLDIPYCHGLTIGELALYFNGEYNIGCKLTVIPMKGWKRNMTFKETHLAWIPTSPNVPENDTPYFVATTGLLGELGLVHIGIGYTLPFKIVGAPWIQAEELAKALNRQKIPGASFSPIHYKPFYGSFKEKECHGVKIHILDPSTYKPLTVAACILGQLKTLYPNEILSKLKSLPPEKKELFNKAYGSDFAYKALLTEKNPTRKLLEHNKEERDLFLQNRTKYLIY